MKYVLILALGILTGLAFNHLPRMELFHDLPPTAKDWTGPKIVGQWSSEDLDVLSRYFNGGVK